MGCSDGTTLLSVPLYTAAGTNTFTSASEGVPVACVAINGAKNAAILAVQIMGAGDEALRQKVIDLKREMAEA